MSVLLKLDAARKPYVAAGEAKAASAMTASPIVVDGGRGDARLATYVKKPAGEKVEKDWRAAGFTPLKDWLGGDRALPPVLVATDDPLLLEGKIDDATLIAVDFAKFSDGRGLSSAALLRKRLGYTHELRAVGDVARDQLFQMARCGFDAFELRDGQDVDDALKAFSDYGDVYQDAADGRAPIFRRRGEANAAAGKAS